DAFDGLIFITDRDQRICYMNNRLIERTGREALGEPWFQVVHGLDSAPDECSGERVFAGETLHQEVFSPLDGRWYYSVEAPIEHADGSVSRQVLMMDINDLKLTEEALLREKERLDVTLGSIGDGVISTDVEGNITLFNREAERLLGCNPINALGQPLSEVYGSVDPTTRQPLDNPVLLAIESGQVIHPPGPALVLAAGDQERLVEETAAPIFDHEGRLIGAVLAFRDITEKQVLQTELIRGQRMESLSIVAAGLAHEFNNHLGVILGSLSLARRQAFDPLLARALEEAEKASVRAKGLTEQLLVYSRAGKPSSRRGAVLGHLLTHAAEMAVQGTSSVVRFQIPDDLWSANVDEEQIRHVVNNLVIHAVQSMPGGGVVTVSAANLLVEATQQTALPPGRYVQVTVHDDGPAIPMDQLARLFEPAQLGKPGIRSLGLFIAGAVIKRHDGHLMAFSQEGEGTTLQFYLPANTPSEHSLTTSLPNATLDRGRVLLLEDEQQLQTVARLMLETLGYKVVVVANGAAAVDEFRQALHAGRPFDLVITDLTIPAGMGGKEAVRQMMELDPGVRAIVSSGYPDDPAMQNYRKFGFSGAVAKPYQLQDLERVIQRVQDEAEA
ncbi:MAG: PAS domain-containing protein, partial [Myxococcota bacterium]|nr:PAS domain-containing protein [Myxococcota bacterium]